jgi:hypothetical protein
MPLSRRPAAASRPRAMLRCHCSHEFNEGEALPDRAAWLRKGIGMRSIVPRLKPNLEESSR